MTYYNVITETAHTLFETCSEFKKEQWYLAGGTSLALQIGHRKSDDFDFFNANAFDSAKLVKKIEQLFSNSIVEIIQLERDTLNILIDSIKFSFLLYPYKLMVDTIEIKECNLAGITDIGCMKLSAITSRATEKDYADLWFIFQKVEPKFLFSQTQKKFPMLNLEIVKKALVYFDDIEQTPLAYVRDNQPDLKMIRKDFETIVKKL